MPTGNLTCHIQTTRVSNPLTNEKGHGQIIAIRKGIKHRELDVTRWSSDNLHLIAAELTEQPVRNIVNMYACNKTLKEQDWMILDDIQTTLPGPTIDLSC